MNLFLPENCQFNICFGDEHYRTLSNLNEIICETIQFSIIHVTMNFLISNDVVYVVFNIIKFC